MKWNDNSPAEDIVFNPTLLDVKIEPKSVEDYRCKLEDCFNNSPSSPAEKQPQSDADLLNIKLEELCSSYFEEKDFTFVEPKACDDAGYDTCTTFSPTSTLDQDWIDSPSSVESFLSSCNEFVDSYQKSNQADLAFEQSNLQSICFSTAAPLQEVIPQIALTPIHQHSSTQFVTDASQSASQTKRTFNSPPTLPAMSAVSEKIEVGIKEQNDSRVTQLSTLQNQTLQNQTAPPAVCLQQTHIAR